ncbi:unnamed protein product [Phytophthora lilii]|uniref:Unnamed protein product n=1 Tax=Phytophthora lilii TaxID=2077276 RepID=A0A9W6TUW7_9STRA|nr:unnamed protein product [Phytophthora lilii]
MSIHGQSIFDVFAKPVVSDDGISVRYAGFATIIQGDKQFTYAVINGATYVEDSVGNDSTSVATKTVRCLDSITPFNSIVAALNTVKVIPSTPSIVEDEYIDCSSGTLLKTSTPFGGLNFTLCSSADGFIAYGGDITMAVQYLKSSPRPNDARH